MYFKGVCARIIIIRFGVRPRTLDFMKDPDNRVVFQSLSA